jgi:hypothetical protein
MHQGSVFQYFRRQEIGVLCFGIYEVMEHNTVVEEDIVKYFDVSAFRVLVG